MQDKFPLIIFDWDGTLMDSVPRIVSSLQTLAEECSLPVPAVTAIHDIIGLSLPVALERLFDIHGEHEQEQLVNVYRDIYVVRDPTPTPMFAGAVTLLETLREAGYQLAVATGKARPGLERAWAQSGTKDLFISSRCAKEVPSKPNPAMLEGILAETGFSAGQALMVGDSIHDMEMARNAGVAGVAVTYGVHDAKRLSAAAPSYVINDINELGQVLL
ncbi:MAG: HAD-IA family hydrolase [Idiomarina sp.]|nr:HAD-IA family hydrolase [Idiomarina sp.]